MTEIQPKCLTLNELLNNRLFKIPDYQRAYSWTSDERKDLFQDIERGLSKGGKDEHFMATIVCLHRGIESLGVKEYIQLDVVDGQQRLTTLTLLLNAIKLNLNENDKKQKRIKEELKELLVKPESDDILLLQTNHDSSKYFQNFLRFNEKECPDKAETLADREILKGMKECLDFVEKWASDGKDVIELYRFIRNRFRFILHQISDEKTVYTVFEVLNSRGMEVAWLDRLKSILMGKAFELEIAKGSRNKLIRELHTTWRQIYQYLGMEQGLSTEVLRFAGTLYQQSQPSKPSSEKDSVAELRKASDAREINSVAHWLLKVTEACHKVKTDPRLNGVTKISQARLLAVAIHLRDDISEDDRNNLLVLWEKVTFRIYGMFRKDARTKVGDYIRLAWRITRDKDKVGVDEISKEIKSIGKGFPVRESVKALRGANCYDEWDEELLYFFYRYEEFLAQEKGNNFKSEHWKKIWRETASRSIEHIIPQSKASDDIKHNIGNLMILPPDLNKKLQDKPPEEKSEPYRETGLLTAGKVASIPKWTKASVRKRQNEILKWAEREWAF